MANNIRVAGAEFFGTKAGHDSNNGTSADTPKATFLQTLLLMSALSDGVPHIAAIGEGVYKESINLTSSGNISTVRKITGNGRVKLRATGANEFRIGNYVWEFNNIIFEDFTVIGIGGSSSSYNFTFNNCEFRNIGQLGIQQRHIYNNCTLINSATNQTGSHSFHNCKILEGSNVWGYFNSCDIDASSRITLINSGSNPHTNHSRLNIRGLLKTNLESTFVNLDTFKVNNPTWLTESFSADPLYNAPMAGVYTVSPNSPNLKTGVNGSNIGGVEIGKAILFDTTVNGDESISPDNPAVTVQDSIDILGNAATVSPDSPGGGYLESDWILVNNGRQSKLKGLEPANNMEFNTSFVGPNIENMNVLDSDNGTPHPDNVQGSPTYELSASRNPNRLTYEMMWSSSVTKPTSYAQADNSGFIPAGTWGKFTWFDAPLVDESGVTNGHEDFNWQQTEPFSEPLCRWVKYRIYMRNNYTS